MDVEKKGLYPAKVLLSSFCESEIKRLQKNSREAEKLLIEGIKPRSAIKDSLYFEIPGEAWICLEANKKNGEKINGRFNIYLRLTAILGKKKLEKKDINEFEYKVRTGILSVWLTEDGKQFII